MDRTPPASSGRSKMQRSSGERHYTSSRAQKSSPLIVSRPMTEGNGNSNPQMEMAPQPAHHSQQTTSLTIEDSENMLSSTDLRAVLHEGLHVRGKYKLVDCRAVKGGEDVGYLCPFNVAETEALYGLNGMVTNRMPLSKNKTTRKPRPRDKNGKRRSSKILGFAFENMRTIYCQTKECPCEAQIFRVQYKNTVGLLYYELINPNTTCTFEHVNHDSFPVQTADSKATDVYH